MKKFLSAIAILGIFNLIFPHSITAAENPNYIFKAREGDLATVQGNALIAYSGPSPYSESQRPVKRILPRIIITAYSSTPDQTDSSPFITAMGTTVHDGIVATNFLPFESKVRLPELYGDKVFVVEDRMATRNSHKMDIWFPTRNDAKQFGVKVTKVEILDI